MAQHAFVDCHDASKVVYRDLTPDEAISHATPPTLFDPIAAAQARAADLATVKQKGQTDPAFAALARLLGAT